MSNSQCVAFEYFSQDAVNSLLYKADAHLKDPVYDCAGIISSLLQEIELAQTKAEIALVGAA
ncbi:LOB domain-containing protein 4-like protein, partial [Tanacetum coccineum]